MNFFTDLIDGVLSLLPDFVEDKLEDRIPFHHEDGKLTVSDLDANHDGETDHQDAYIHKKFDELKDGVKKQIMKFDDAGDITDKLGELTNKADDVKNVASDIFDAINKLK